MRIRELLQHWTAPHQHGVATGPATEVATASAPARAVRVAVTIVLSVSAAATVFGAIALWPNYGEAAKVASSAEFSAADVRYEQGEILTLDEGCAQQGGTSLLGQADAGTQQGGGSEADSGAAPGTTPERAAPRCRTAGIGILSGPDHGQVVDVPLRGSLAHAGLREGDRVELMAMPTAVTGPVTQGGEGGPDSTAPDATSEYQMRTSYGVTGIDRAVPLLVLAIAFVAAVVAVGRVRGALALAALALSAAVLLGFVLPALVTGGPGVAIGLVASTAIMFVTLYFVHGPSLRTTAALIGTLVGIACITGLAAIASAATRLSGIGDDASSRLSAMSGAIDFRGLLICSILIAGLGVLNDVTITQASAVWELRAAGPALSRREIADRAMRIGRDHIASTVYTVFFAYVGAALSVLILLFLYNRPMLSVLTTEDIAIEIVSTLCGSIGLVLAVPVTTWIAVALAPGPTLDRATRARTIEEAAGAGS
ncbi:YibE/F family protein [Leucobacter sp. CSA2]|uniref:YibE/F family protein n=1 Tax=Leucobacter edaphi TaxID=2796472 RepID=A0A934QF18_9MICO|nr:YibE/F family protein [Leucobacter edaphi]MBK0422077.1 YibE/F family protein [Leucobacter edaphi]